MAALQSGRYNFKDLGGGSSDGQVRLFRVSYPEDSLRWTADSWQTRRCILEDVSIYPADALRQFFSGRLQETSDDKERAELARSMFGGLVGDDTIAKVRLF